MILSENRFPRFGIMLVSLPLSHAFPAASSRSSLAPMTERPKLTQKERREQRLQAALRENLKRRKAQARRRAEIREQPAEPHDSAGIAADKPNG